MRFCGPRPLGPKEIDGLLVPPGKAYSMLTGYLITRDVNKYSNVRIFAFHTNIRMRFLDSNIHIIF